jgi:2-methylisocitrate lyase-like PEP mutase family enzyme
VGADVLYAPALKTIEEVLLVTGALNNPFNVLAPFVKDANVAQLAEAGAKRISVGGALARAALTVLIRGGSEMQNSGSFNWSANSVSSSELKKLLG